MPILDRESVERFCEYYSDELSLWQTFLFCLWAVSILFRKVCDASSSFLERWFFESLGGDGSSPGRTARSEEDFPEDSVGNVAPSASAGGESSAGGTLILLLPDIVTRERIWPVLMSPLSVPLLLQLRCVSVPWSRFVTTTLEWNVWLFVRLDSYRCAMT